MKIKRYFAADTRKALRMVRDDLGPDALIISNRSVDDGVEILAAEDFDEELAAKGVVDTRDAVEITDATVEPRPPAAPDRETAPAEAKPQAAATTPKPDDVVTSDVILKALKKKRPEPKKERSGESELIATMRDELARLRGMMENQFSALSQGQWSQHSPIRNELVQQLTRIGLAPTLATRLVASIRHAEQLTPQLATREVLALLTKKIRINGQSILDQRGAVAMIGPAGAGKTTTIAKITSQFVRKHGNENIILLSADNHRIGAHEQLLAYGELFDVPVLRAREPQEIRQIIQAVGSNSLVLIEFIHEARAVGDHGHLDLARVRGTALGALDAAGLPHARIKVKSGYTVDDIRECLENKLIPYRRLQNKMAQLPTHNPEPPKRPTRPVRSSRPAAA